MTSAVAIHFRCMLMALAPQVSWWQQGWPAPVPAAADARRETGVLLPAPAIRDAWRPDCRSRATDAPAGNAHPPGQVGRATATFDKRRSRAGCRRVPRWRCPENDTAAGAADSP